LFFVALGGAVGALARYGLGGWIQGRTGFEFPWGTLVVNVVGSLMIGFSIRYLEAVRIHPEIRALVTVGIFGAFTTFSTFTYETVAMLESGAWSRAGGYCFGSLALGLAGVYLGIFLSAQALQAR